MARLREASVYVTTHRKYFAGTYQGIWTKLRHYPSGDLFEARSKEIHSDDPAPRFYYYDWKHIPPGWISAQKIQSLLFDLIGYLLQDYDEEEDEALFNWCLLCTGQTTDVTDFLQWFRAHYKGKYLSPSDFAFQFAQEKLGINPRYHPRFNVEAYTMNLFRKDYFIKEGYVYKRSTITR